MTIYTKIKSAKSYNIIATSISSNSVVQYFPIAVILAIAIMMLAIAMFVVWLVPPNPVQVWLVSMFVWVWLVPVNTCMDMVCIHVFVVA